MEGVTLSIKPPVSPVADEVNSPVAASVSPAQAAPVAELLPEVKRAGETEVKRGETTGGITGETALSSMNPTNALSLVKRGETEVKRGETPPVPPVVSPRPTGGKVETRWVVELRTISPNRRPLKARLMYRSGNKWKPVTREMVDAGQAVCAGSLIYVIKKLTLAEAERIERMGVKSVRNYFEQRLNRRS